MRISRNCLETARWLLEDKINKKVEITKWFDSWELRIGDEYKEFKNNRDLFNYMDKLYFDILKKIKKGRVLKMMKVVNDIVRAQDFLKERYGEEGYKKIMAKLKEKTNNDPVLLLAMYKDERYLPETRLAALAALGE